MYFQCTAGLNSRSLHVSLYRVRGTEKEGERVESEIRWWTYLCAYCPGCHCLGYHCLCLGYRRMAIASTCGRPDRRLEADMRGASRGHISVGGGVQAWRTSVAFGCGVQHEEEGGRRKEEGEPSTFLVFVKQ